MKNKKYYHKNPHVTIRDKEQIEHYLSDVKSKVRDDLYRVERNDKRQENNNLFLRYVIDKNKVKEILLNLNSEDYSETRPNEHKGYENELLYIFGKTVFLTERIGENRVKVPLYIKINNREKGPVIIISFHKQKFTLKYYFKKEEV